MASFIVFMKHNLAVDFILRNLCTGQSWRVETYLTRSRIFLNCLVMNFMMNIIKIRLVFLSFMVLHAPCAMYTPGKASLFTFAIHHEIKYGSGISQCLPSTHSYLLGS